MALTVPLDRAAILVIECQNDLVHESRIGTAGIGGALAAAVKARDMLARIARVVEAARAADLPILYLNKESKPGLPMPAAPIFRIARRHPILCEGTWGAEIHPTIAPRASDYVIRRFLGVDASGDSGVFGTLRALARSVLVAMGVSTNFAVEGTVRGAVNRGFDVVVLEDCCTSVPDELHRFSVERILPLLATVADSAALLEALQRCPPSS